MKPTLETLHGQPSYSIRSDAVEAHVTQTAGMLGPVTFTLGKKKVSPFSVAPWALNGETIDKGLPPLLHALRGDFFCLPFGGNENPTEESILHMVRLPTHDGVVVAHFQRRHSRASSSPSHKGASWDCR